MKQKHELSFRHILANTLVANITNMTVWFAIIFFIYLQTEAVLSTAITSGLFLVATSLTGFWFGSLVDNHKKKTMMIISSIISLVMFIISFVLYINTPLDEFKNIENPILWTFVVLLLAGVIAGNIRSVALPTLVSILIPEDRRDKANGMVGTVTGVGFLVVSVISGLLVGHSGMYLVLILASLFNLISILHLLTISIPELKPVHAEHDPENPEATTKGIDIKGTFNIVKKIPGLFPLILFSTINNFLGGVFMALMDAYGLELVSVQVWGLLWGLLSTTFIVGGIIISTRGLGKNPLKALFSANITIWIISCIFTIQPWIALLMAGMFIYLAVVPFIEAAEHTIIQKVVPKNRQGRVFGFAQSLEQAASPLTSFLIGPIAQFIFIPFMTTGAGVELIGDWFGVGTGRGIALVFTITGIIGLCVTLLAMRTRYYRELGDAYRK